MTLPEARDQVTQAELVRAIAARNSEGALHAAAALLERTTASIGGSRVEAGVNTAGAREGSGER